MTAKFGKIIANTRPGGLEIYLDGQPVLDSSGNMAKTPVVILNVSPGPHNVTFSKVGWDTTTVMVNVEEGLDSYARAILATKSIRYPMMLGNGDVEGQLSPEFYKPPVPQIHFGNLVANTIPEGAEIYIDGQPIFDTTGKILTTPANVLGVVVGKHTMTLRKKGYSDMNIDTYIENGLYSDVSTILRPLMTGMTPVVILEPEKGDVLIDTIPPGAQIYIDEKVVLDSMGNPIRTPAMLTLNAGWHDLVVYLEKFCREDGPIYVYPGNSTHIHKDLLSPPCE